MRLPQVIPANYLEMEGKCCGWEKKKKKVEFLYFVIDKRLENSLSIMQKTYKLEKDIKQMQDNM